MKTGSIVSFTGKSDSWDFDDSSANAYINDGLVIGKEYTVLEVSEGDYSTHITISEEGKRWYPTSFFKLINE